MLLRNLTLWYANTGVGKLSAINPPLLTRTRILNNKSYFYGKIYPYNCDIWYTKKVTKWLQNHDGVIKHIILPVFISNNLFSRMPGRVQIDGGSHVKFAGHNKETLLAVVCPLLHEQMFQEATVSVTRLLFAFLLLVIDMQQSSS